MGHVGNHHTEMEPGLCGDHRTHQMQAACLYPSVLHSTVWGPRKHVLLGGFCTGIPAVAALLLALEVQHHTHFVLGDSCTVEDNLCSAAEHMYNAAARTLDHLGLGNKQVLRPGSGPWNYKQLVGSQARMCNPTRAGYMDYPGNQQEAPRHTNHLLVYSRHWMSSGSRCGQRKERQDHSFYESRSPRKAPL